MWSVRMWGRRDSYIAGDATVCGSILTLQWGRVLVNLNSGRFKALLLVCWNDLGCLLGRVVCRSCY
jgi:hypothetical protein